MFFGDNTPEPGPTWRDRLRTSLFSSYASTPKAQPSSPDTSDTAETTLASTDSNSMKAPLNLDKANEEAQGTRHSLDSSAQSSPRPTTAKETRSHPIAVQSDHRPQSYPPDTVDETSSISSSLAHSKAESESERADVDDRIVPSSLTSSKKKSLTAIFSTKMPGLSGPRVKRVDGSVGSSTGEPSFSESVRPASIGQSISLGVKSLHERHRLNREATETFKTMKMDEGGDTQPTKDKRISGESVEEVVAGRMTATMDRASTGQATMALSATDIPEEMLHGESMLKVTPKKVMQRVFRLDSDRGQILWDSKKNNKVNLESIREVRTADAAASYRTSMSIAMSHEPRWISIIYQTGGVYKAVHLIALSDESFRRWKDTLSAFQNERKMLMSGMDVLDQRQQLWLRKHWKAADTSEDSRLNFVEVTKLCRRLGILSNGKDLLNRFREADKQGKGFLNFEDFQHFVTLLKQRIDIESLFLLWADVGIEKDVLRGCDFSNEVGLELTRQRLHAAVQQASISLDRFVTFLKQEQGYSTVKEDAVVDIMKRYSEASEQPLQMNLPGFSSFLMSGDNALLSDQCPLLAKESLPRISERENAQTTDELIALSSQEKTRQDMTRPLSEYFVSSSHNTYLVGGQWKGDSTVEGYVRALLQGARSVEIDCWDGPGNEPQVTHGRTLTSKVPFRDVIGAIERYAFVASPFPLILSLEVHNDVAQQDTLAFILRDTLGDKLLTAPLNDSKSGLEDHLPSPKDLKGKVLVKAKNLLMAEGQSGNADGVETMPLLVAEKQSTTSATDTTESESDNILQSARGLVRSVTKRKVERSGEADSKTQGKKTLMSPQLASLLIYTIGVKHRGINKKEHYNVEHMISLSEKSGLKYLKSEVNCEDLIKHNRTHLTRVYPSMSSFKRLSQSANFLPSLFWSMGCQLVAMNWQTLDVGFEMNQAMFSRNARCGYVLKPEALRLKETAKSSSPRQKIEVQVSVQIISAQQLPRFRDAFRDKELDNEDVIDPFVSLCIVVPQHRDYSVKSIKSVKKKRQSGMQSLLSDTKDDHSSSTSPSVVSPSSTSKSHRSWICRQKTSVVKSNGFNPIWNETLSFSISFNVARSSSASTSDELESIQTYTKGLLDLCFLRFEVGENIKLSLSRSIGGEVDINDGHDDEGSSDKSKDGNSSEEEEQQQDNTVNLESLGEHANCLATHMISLGSLAKGYRHVPLYDAQLSQYLFSTLFVKSEMHLLSTTVE